MDPILTATLVVGGTGLVCGGALALAARYLSVPEDPRIRQVADCLPGINCGGCGYAGCGDYARAIIEEDAAVTLCAPGGPDLVAVLSRLLGVEAAGHARRVAVVRCGGSDPHAARRGDYNGIEDCAAAQLVDGGDKTCTYGCLGYGSCARVCPVNAISMGANRLAVVDKTLCIGCRKCVATCPRALIAMVPAERSIHVLCRSRDKGPVVRKACSVGCIGCRACTRKAEGVINMDGFLAVVDYDKPLDDDDVVAACPTHCIQRDA